MQELPCWWDPLPRDYLARALEDSTSTRPWRKAELENLCSQCGWATYMQRYMNRSQVATSLHNCGAKIYPKPPAESLKLLYK